jgi:hypothetical protein
MIDLPEKPEIAADWLWARLVHKCEVVRPEGGGRSRLAFDHQMSKAIITEFLLEFFNAVLAWEPSDAPEPQAHNDNRTVH